MGWIRHIETTATRPRRRPSDLEVNDERSVLFEALFADWCDVDEGGPSDVPTCAYVGATGTIGHVASDDLGRQPGRRLARQVPAHRAHEALDR